MMHPRSALIWIVTLGARSSPRRISRTRAADRSTEPPWRNRSTGRLNQAGSSRFRRRGDMLEYRLRGMTVAVTPGSAQRQSPVPPETYDPAIVEEKWRTLWRERGTNATDLSGGAR